MAGQPPPPPPADDSSPDASGLYPRIDPYRTGDLAVSDLHTVYYEISGNPDGLPVLFVHGGPGGGTVPSHRRFFNPQVYKIVLFDQRGCGQSRPFACLEQNTTWDLIDDMERVREACGVQQWILFGGSWGSTLSIAYAQEHPTRTIGLILRGIFLARDRELRWLYERDGAAMVYPEAFQRYLNGLPPRMRDADSLMQAYHTILSRETHDEERRKAANAWSQWEHTLSSFPRGDEVDDDEAEEEGDAWSDHDNLAFARIENHFFVNRGFFKTDGYLLADEQMRKIARIKTRIVQGRWDMVCPRVSAYDIAQKFEKDCVDVVLVENAGHSTFEPGIESGLLKACDEFGKEFGWMSTEANG